jgi:glyoxylase-like metal-dependent hydrolase (beta-lactamase superfamily II)/rhodanese-related sulfurtransferase
METEGAMILKKYYLKCLSHGSYFLADEESREAAIVDPQRDIDQYLAILTEEGFRLKYVLETHVHADFVSGHWELAAKTGAEVVYGAKAMATLPHRKVKDGEDLFLGTSMRIHVLETPGHTPESVCYLVSDARHPDAPPALFSGDTLFAGDVGRPDLLGSRMPASELASMMYATLRDKIKPLPDVTRVYPAHGAGSACGKHIGNVEFTTIGDEKKGNEAMQEMDRDAFVHLLTSDLPDAPGYFAEDAKLNLGSVRPLEDIVKGLRALSPEEAEAGAARGAWILDTRDPEDFSEASIPGAINIGLEGQFAPWLGTLIERDVPLILVCEDGHEEESAMRCARIGYENVLGRLEGGMEAWARAGKPVSRFPRLAPADVAPADDGAERNGPGHEDAGLLLDVRNPSETEQGNIPGATAIPLGRLRKEMGNLAGNRNFRVYCGGGYRSSMAASLLRKLLGAEVRDVRGGFSAYRKAGLPIQGS